MATITKSGKKMGRPTRYSAEVCDKICARLAEGRSLKSICASDDMPCLETVFAWLRVNTDFSDKYARAKQESADALSDDIEDIAEDVRLGKLDPNAGRVAGDLKKWVASKLKPKKYGDHLDLTTKGKELPAPILGGLSTNGDIRLNNGD